MLNFLIFAFYFILCYAVAVLGTNKKFGFSGNFLASVFFTPLVGIILLLAQNDEPHKESDH